MEPPSEGSDFKKYHRSENLFSSGECNAIQNSFFLEHSLGTIANHQYLSFKLFVLVTSSRFSYKRLTWPEQGVIHIVTSIVPKICGSPFSGFMYLLEGMGDRIVPCGISKHECQCLTVVPSTTCQYQSERQDKNHQIMGCGHPLLSASIHPLLSDSISQATVINRMVDMPVEFSRFRRLELFRILHRKQICGLIHQGSS